MADFKLDQTSFVPFSHSAAGHQGISSNASGTIIIKPCTQAEIDFYTIASTEPAHAAFYAHMPHFYGSLKASPDQEALKSLLDTKPGEGVAGPTPEIASGLQDAPPNVAALTPSHTDGDKPVVAETWQPSGGKQLSTGLMLAISNATAGITKPCVLDVKLGARLWDDAAPLPKRQKLDEVSAASTSGSLGFRVAGMKAWSPDTAAAQTVDEEEQPYCELKDGFKAYNKFYGRDLNKDTVKKAFESFLGGVADGKLKRKHASLLLSRFIRDLESLEATLQNEESRMYSASILLVYEGDDAALERALEIEKKAAHAENQDENEDEDEDDEEDEEEPKVHDVCIIDFAHAKFEPGAGPDENALQGVRSALAIFKSFVD